MTDTTSPPTPGAAALLAAGFTLTDPPDTPRSRASAAFFEQLSDREFYAVVDALEKCAREEGKN